MSALFDVGMEFEIAAERSKTRTPERCPMCGKMAEYVERFVSGRYMAAHAGYERKVIGKVSGREMLVKCARVCHGVEKMGGA